MIRTLPLLQAQPRRAVLALEVAVAFGLLLAAVPTRLGSLDAFGGKFDEGIRGEQLLLMAAGYRPFRDIFASQGPLSLDVFFPSFMLFGQTLGAARMAPAVLSLVAAGAAGWAARLLVGPGGAFATAALLLVSPTFLKNSRLALVEVPALAFASVGVALAVAYHVLADRRWAAASGVAMALALLTKPMVAPALAPIVLLILLRGPGGRGALVRFVAAGSLVSALVILAAGPSDVYDQMVRFRLASRRVEGWSLKENWAAMAGEWRDEQLALFGLAAGAALLLLVARPRVGLALVAWPAASLALLMVYSPIQFKHAAVMLPPVALLAGVGVGEWLNRVGAGLARSVDRHERPIRRLANALVVALGGAVLLWYAASLPAIAGLDRRVLLAQPETRPESYDDEIAQIGALTAPGDYILVDEPAVAFATRRLVPPRLVDTSMVRIRSRSLDADEVIAASEEYDVRLMFLFSDGLRSLKPFADWVDERYVAVKINERRNGKDRAIYLRDDVDLEQARLAFERTLGRRGGPSFGGELRLLGYSLEPAEARPGGALAVTTGWQAVGDVKADYHVLAILRDATGTVVEQNERSLGGGAEGTASWERGRWVFRTSSLPIRGGVAPGDYRLSVALYDSKSRRTLGPDSSVDGEHPLGVVRIRA